MTSLTSIFNQELEQEKNNGGHRVTEIKVQKTCALYFAIDRNLATFPGKTYCLQKCKKKNGYRKCDHRGTIGRSEIQQGTGESFKF